MSFYVVKGTNGVIIKQSYAQAYRCRTYLQKNTIKKYDYLSEAESAARGHLEEILPTYLPVPESIKLDEMVTVRKLIQAEMEKEKEKNKEKEKDREQDKTPTA